MADWFLNFIFETLLQEGIAVIAGILFVLIVQNQWIKFKYGGWRVVIVQDGDQKVSRDISPGKVREIQTETSELAVFLKGVASPYAWINCDIIEHGETSGLLIIDKDKKCYTLNLDKNPPRRTSSTSMEN